MAERFAKAAPPRAGDRLAELAEATTEENIELNVCSVTFGLNLGIDTTHVLVKCALLSRSAGQTLYLAANL
jgi:hypothetical protein